MPMTTTEYQGNSSSVAMSFRGHSMLSLRRNQVVSMEQELQDLDLFHVAVAERLLSLLPSTRQKDNHKQDDEGKQQQLLSLAFLRKLLDAFLGCEEDFKSLLLRFTGNRTLISKPPLDCLVSDLLDRTVKSLDICNAATLALDYLRHWHRHADIAVAALLPYHRDPLTPLFGEGQLNRAKKALTKLLATMPTDPIDASSTVGSTTERAWSFSRKNRREANSRSLSLSVSRPWSAPRKVLAGLRAPRVSDAAGLGLAVYTMSSVLVLVMSALVAAFLCQERGGYAPSLAAPLQHLAWAGPMAALQELIADEWKKKEKKGSHPWQGAAGLLTELQELERSSRGLMEQLCDSGGGRTEEMSGWAEELREACRRLEREMGPFEKKVREVFHRIVATRAEVQQCLDRSTRATVAMVL